MKSHDNRDDEVRRPPRPWRLIWIVLGVVGFVVLATGGIVLGLSSPDLPASSADAAEEPSSQQPPCDETYMVDEAARLCYLVPASWTAVSIAVGVGPSSTIVAEDADATATAHFGAAANLPVNLAEDLSGTAEALVDYACDLFTVAECDSTVNEHDIDGYDAITATAGGRNAVVTVTTVGIDEGYSYAISVSDEAHRADAEAIHASLRVI